MAYPKVRLIFAAVIFFFTFFRLELVVPGFYVSLLFGVMGALWCLHRGAYRPFRGVIDGTVAKLLVLLLVLSFTQDLFGDGNFSSNSFTFRIIFLIVMSALPAYLMSVVYVRGSHERLHSVVRIGFYTQFLLWVVTFLSPDLKTFLYEITARGDSVNLNIWNLETRGFGLSKEINYTSPYMMILVSLLFLRDKRLSLVTIPTQLINSNLSVIAIVMSVLLTRLKVYVKVLIVLVVSVVVLFFGDEFFGRLYSEFGGGQSRTLNSLSQDHFFVLNSTFFEHLFGLGAYVFQGGDYQSSDSGWIIMYNYGGLMFVSLFTCFATRCVFVAFGFTPIGLAMIASVFLLNTKGLLLGPNAFYFVLFLFGLTHRTTKLAARSRKSPDIDL